MRFSRVTNALTVTCLGIIGIMALTPPAACLLQDPGNEAELIVIVPDEFAAAVAPLEQLREGEGIETEIVLLSEVLSEFGGGCADTMAIRNFLLYAFENWRSMPRYILLAGDADSGGAEGPIPAPREITERNGLTPYDDWYVQLDADDLPDAAIGRIPMTNATDMASVVDKLVEYASVGPPGGENPIVTFLLTDSANISGVSQELIRWWGRHLAGDYAYAVADTVVLRSGTLIGDPPLSCTECMPAMVDAIDAGTLILHHIGVSSSDGSSWRDFIDIDEGGNFTVYDLSNAGRYPLVINSNCGTGRFTNNWTVSQELLSGADCGAIAVIAPTRNSDPNPAGYFAEDLYDELLLGKHTVGECLLLAKHRFGEDWGWLDWQAREMELFGDPSFSLPLPQDVPDPLTQLFVDFEINETGCQQNVLASSSNLSNPDSRARVRQGIIGDVAPNTGRRMYEVRAQAENPGTGCYAEWDVLDLISEGGLRISIDRLGVGEVTARYLRFWINVPSCPASGGFSVGGRLRSGDTLWSSTFALTDQYGRYLAPGGATGATDGWEERYIDLAPAMGDTLDSIVIGYQDVSGVAGQALAFVDGIEIRERWHGTDPTCHNLVLNASMGWDSDGDRVADAWGDSLLQPGERAADRTTHDSRTGISSAVIFNSDNADDIAVQAIACDMDTWHRLQYFLKYTTPTRVRATITEVSSDEVVASFRDSAGSDWTENVHWFKSSNTGRMHRLAFLPEQKRRPVLIDDVRVTTMDCLHSSVEVLGLGADSRDYAVMLEWAASYHRVVGEFHTSGWIDVYRSEDGGVNYEHVGSRHITAAWPTTQDCWFLDSGLPSGETFHYILRGGIGGEWGPVTGTPTHPPKTPPAVIIPPLGAGELPATSHVPAVTVGIPTPSLL